MREIKKVEIELTKGEFVVIQMSVGAFKFDLEKNDPNKLSIPSLFIDEVWEKVKALNWNKI